MTLEAPKPGSTPSQPHSAPLPTENLLHQPHWPSQRVFSTPHTPHALPLILQALECSSLPTPQVLALFCLEISAIRPKANGASCLTNQN